MCSHKILQTKFTDGGIIVSCSSCHLSLKSPSKEEPVAIDHFLAHALREKNHNVHDVSELDEGNIDRWS